MIQDLPCVTSNINTACCTIRNNNGTNNQTAGVVGEWSYPNGTKVVRDSNSSNADILAVFGYTHQIRLAKVEFGSTPPLGMYTCKVPNPSTGVVYEGTINIQNSKWVGINNSFKILQCVYLYYKDFLMLTYSK